MLLRTSTLRSTHPYYTQAESYRGAGEGFSRGVGVGDALDVAGRVVDGDSALGRDLLSVKAHLVGLEVIGDGVGNVQQQHVRLAVIEQQLRALAIQGQIISSNFFLIPLKRHTCQLYDSRGMSKQRQTPCSTSGNPQSTVSDLAKIAVGDHRRRRGSTCMTCLMGGGRSLDLQGVS